MSRLTLRWRRTVRAIVAVALLGATACIHTFYKSEVREVPAPTGAQTTTIRTPVKVHMSDGATVLFTNGATVNSEAIRGTGAHYALFSTAPVARASVPLDSVVGVETYEGTFQSGLSVVVSLAATAAAIPAAALLAVAIFGSCPTVYASTPQGHVLEAEGFSYSISPMMEQRDLDPLRAVADADGRVRLELRNEALETHFINHIELVTARHPVGTRLVPDQRGTPVLVSTPVPLRSAQDRAGRDVRAALATADGTLFSTAPATVRAAHTGDLDDWIDLDADTLPPGDSIAVVLRLRNSLLNTILLYEGMLGGRDALDWLATDLQHVARTVDLARWYVATMGMRAEVNGVPLPVQAPFVGHARLGDVGPIAFRDVAMVLPRPVSTDGSGRVRLRFVADNWRIDQVEITGIVGRPAVRLLAVDSVIVPVPVDGGPARNDPDAVRALEAADQQYFETRPGQRMTLVFAGGDAPRPEAGETVTNLIAWQGWYNEWVRGAWLAAPTRTTAFVPGDETMLIALRRWTERKQSFEREFYASKLPVR